MARDAKAIGLLGAKIRWEVNEPPYKERFWKRVHVGSAGGCWPWKGKPNKKSGYGNIKYYGRWTSAHRIAYLLSNGEIPKGLNVLHHCDNRICCNPLHLFAGTHKDNIQDALKKGRLNPPKGENQPTHKLSENDVHTIRKLIKDGQTQRSIAADFGVSHSTIYAINQHRSWKHI